MCTALNLAITERAGGRGEAGGQVCAGLQGFRKVVPAGAARRVSLQRGVLAGTGAEELKPGTTVAVECNHWENMRILGRCNLLFPAPARPDGTRGTGIWGSGVQAGIGTSKINNPNPIFSPLQHDTKAQETWDQGVLGPLKEGQVEGGSPPPTACSKLPWKDRGNSDPGSLKLKGRTAMSMA